MCCPSSVIKALYQFVPEPSIVWFEPPSKEYEHDVADLLVVIFANNKLVSYVCSLGEIIVIFPKDIPIVPDCVDVSYLPNLSEHVTLYSTDSCGVNVIVYS